VGCAPERTLRLSPDALGRLGLDATTVGEQLAGALLGEVATSIRRPDHLEPVRVSAPGARGSAGAGLAETRVLTPAGDSVGTDVLGAISRSCLPAELLRENQRNLVHLTARLSGVGLGAATREVHRRLAGLHLPAGYTRETGGLQAQQAASFRSLAVALVLALLAVSGVLLFQLGTLRRTVFVLGAAPVALAGGLALLWVTGVALNVSSIMGAILLIGLVVKNGILLVDHAMIAEQRGLDRRAAVLEAGQQRLRPILMTSLATLLALLPLALGLGAGAALHRPLALVVVGGLAFGTLATLLVLPALLAGDAGTRGEPAAAGR
jgi:multidrug efflux pump subunit AcrB